MATFCAARPKYLARRVMAVAQASAVAPAGLSAGTSVSAPRGSLGAKETLDPLCSLQVFFLIRKAISTAMQP